MTRKKDDRVTERPRRPPARARGPGGSKPGMSGKPVDNEGLVMDSETLTSHHQQRPKPDER